LPLLYALACVPVVYFSEKPAGMVVVWARVLKFSL